MLLVLLHKNSTVHPPLVFSRILSVVGVNSNIFAYKLIKGINLAHAFHYFCL